MFIRKEYKEILIASLKYCVEKKGLEIYGWCIMTSHVHLIIRSKREKLEDIMRNIKKHTFQALIKAIKENLTESRREWMLWFFERQVNVTQTMNIISFGNNTTSQLS